MTRTVFLARLLGLYCLIIALALVAHPQASLSTLEAMVHSPDILLVTGVMAVLGGLAMVIGHNVWSGGARAVVVTVVGWVVLLKGLIVLLLPMEAVVAWYDLLHIEQGFYLYMLLTAVLGAYLTYVGFARSSSSTPTRDRVSV